MVYMIRDDLLNYHINLAVDNIMPGYQTDPDTSSESAHTSDSEDGGDSDADRQRHDQSRFQPTDVQYAPADGPVTDESSGQQIDAQPSIINANGTSNLPSDDPMDTSSTSDGNNNIHTTDDEAPFVLMQWPAHYPVPHVAIVDWPQPGDEPPSIIPPPPYIPDATLIPRIRQMVAQLALPVVPMAQLPVTEHSTLLRPLGIRPLARMSVTSD